ncbi:hypothetical protein FO440_15165 [Mucilaginibacter corticis]|uniref:Uncharacterized protein n=1 Tax=Mucilaginibacter corticis TaxID=2597670 RepID=A0A556MMA2_9SPHI|nr:hypothetical protein [Mucilaginibacter corticis]TSJ41067.1 hypothetical protein FO440_15165 [Mucilaginibacter corticis]
MKLFIITLFSLMSYQAIAQEKTLTPQERGKAIRLLEQTETGVFDAVKGLTEAQLNYKTGSGQMERGRMC